MSIPSSDTAAMRQIIRALKAAGHKLNHVYDGEESIDVTGEQEALDAINAVDMAHLHVDLADGSTGWVYFVLGNDPEEVAADYTVNLSPALDELTESWF